MNKELCSACPLQKAKDLNFALAWMNDERPTSDPTKIAEFDSRGLIDKDLAVRCEFRNRLGLCIRTQLES